MPNPYGEIFRAPGALAFSSAGFVARLPASMVGLGIVTMLSERRGEYAIAGAVAATFALASALITPQISRLVDRYGQRRVLMPATVAAALALSALMLSTWAGAPSWLLFVFALLSGLMPSIGAMVRARWTEFYRDTPQLRTAFAFESVVDEIIFMVGPIVAIGLSVSLFPEAGPLAALLFLVVGVPLLCVQRRTEPPVRADAADADVSVIRLGGVQVVVLAMIAVGAIFGTAEITAVAFAEAQGQKAMASVVLAIYAAGSLIVGLVFGTLKLKATLATQFLAAITLAALTTLPLLAVEGLVSLALVFFLAGAAVSPTIIIAMGLIERLVSPRQLTEGMTWGITGIGIGMAFGASAAGALIDAFGARSGFWISVAAGVAALLVTLIGYSRLLGERKQAVLCEAA
ncbi:MFS transporter [Bosea sp. NBC_00550]|uniref:MFS transporter n=1 Tax=Bosea sp. NBC_00550 TaxID=2969621 RepID=UPI0022300247|nr:MFS transporter [Bosea sp. NBC_00550]UZF92563.1 MFS transporter [Bosea sp. NBC_00550]